MDQLTITFLTASTALIAGIASPLVSISAARRQFKASENKTIDLEQWRGHLEAITVAGHAVLDAEWERVKRGE